MPAGTGLGIAISSYVTGAGIAIYWNDMPHSGVIVTIDRGGGVAVLCGSSDIGQGSDTMLAQIVADELGIALLDIRVYTGDTDLTPVDLGSYSSRVTFMAGNAARPPPRKLQRAAVRSRRRAPRRPGRAPHRRGRPHLPRGRPRHRPRLRGSRAARRGRATAPSAPSAATRRRSSAASSRALASASPPPTATPPAWPRST